MSMSVNDQHHWDERVRVHGHTGWKHRLIHDYDQSLRLRTLGGVLADQNLRGERALDFGCGVGDFVSLLRERYPRVEGTDLSAAALAKARARHVAAGDAVKFFPSPSDLPEQRYDLALTVTVLMFVPLDDLGPLLKSIARSLRPGGVLLALESFGKESYTEADFLLRAREAELELDQKWNFYHPVRAPTLDFVEYIARAALRMPSAKDFPRRANGLVAADSPTKILLLRRKGSHV